MEMPEGWDRLFKPNYADGDFKKAMLEAGSLMKEMAEALEAIEKGPHYAGAVYQVLKRFREWK